MKDEESVSASTPTVTHRPDGAGDTESRKTMAGKYGIVVAVGLGTLSQRVFRVGDMGNVNRNDLLATVAAIEGSPSEQGHNLALGAGIAAANGILERRG